MTTQDQVPQLLSPLLLPQDIPPPQLIKLSIDQILQTSVGEFGYSQFLHFSLVSLVWCLHGLLTLVMTFADRTPPWHCIDTHALVQQATNISSPLSHIGHLDVPLLFSSSPMVDAAPPNPSPASYTLCNTTSSICSLDASLWEWTKGDRESTISEWGLTCGQSYKVGLVQSMYFTGTLLGAGVYGSLSDSFLGRKGVLVVTCTLSSLCGLLTALSPNYWIYLTLRMATGFNCGGMGPAAFLLATETIGPSKRGPASIASFFFFSVGIILLSTLAYFTASWRHLYLLISSLDILYCLLVLPFLRESPRWHLAHGRVDVALDILKQIAVGNGRTIPSSVTLGLDQQAQYVAETEDAKQSIKIGVEDAPASDQIISGVQTAGGHGVDKAMMLDIFRVSTTRLRMMIMLVIWLSNGLIYYGINLEVPNIMGDNISMGLILNAVAEMPAYAITAMMLQRYGRRPVLIGAMGMAGMSCMVGMMVGGSKVKMGSGVAAIFGLASAYNLLFIYTAELFPTEVRNVAMGLAAQASQVGAIAAPFVSKLGLLHEWAPFLVFSIFAFLGSSLAWWLPETLEKPLYETMRSMIE